MLKSNINMTYSIFVYELVFSLTWPDFLGLALSARNPSLVTALVLDFHLIKVIFHFELAYLIFK